MSRVRIGQDVHDLRQRHLVNVGIAQRGLIPIPQHSEDEVTRGLRRGEFYERLDIVLLA